MANVSGYNFCILSILQCKSDCKKKKAKTKLSPKILGIGYLNTTSQCTFIYFNEKSIIS